MATAAATSLGTPSVHAQKDRQALRFVPHAELKILDPVWTTTYITRNHGYLVYDTLFGTDENLQIKPQMIDRTTVSPDGMKYTFTLRDGLHWHDGQPVLSEDCTESLKRWGKKDRFGQLLMASTAKIAPDQVTYLYWSIGQPEYYRPCYSVFACGRPHATTVGAGPMIEHDLSKARQLVQESGYDGSPIVVRHVTDIRFLTAAAVVTRQRLESVGFKVILKGMDWSTMSVVPPPDRGSGAGGHTRNRRCALRPWAQVRTRGVNRAGR